ncbi:1357_t:CDS:2 [Funneliformis geosporum]|uniref:5726_t:CDS:1 n=1 Tax=Funneliformis geosporum TaxID=1117311 RepID=A0A9W4SLS0_9GLOM|nr:1357_t:CDS:2 [Funneliformis geosporum]CAI2174096.1 5726_t:CDS:2 [Funneliformis geosporum]
MSHFPIFLYIILFLTNNYLAQNSRPPCVIGDDDHCGVVLDINQCNSKYCVKLVTEEYPHWLCYCAGINDCPGGNCVRNRCAGPGSFE